MKSGRFLIRNVSEDDLGELYKLSRLLYFINLPEDRELLAEKIEYSKKSFSGELEDKFEREYIFIMEDLDTEEVVGTSSIIARHGDAASPHMYFELRDIKKYSQTIHSGFIHKVLRLRFDHDGPTEIGGLVISPSYRNHPRKLGRQLSFARFQFMKMHRRWFKDRVISELMPPLSEDGESLLWEAIGRKFTGLSYEEADQLSRNNKEFVTSLFPKNDIYVTLLPAEVREVIGQVGEQTEPVKHMLERIGFQWKEHVDPFDGGPHYWAETDKISVVRNTRSHRIHGALEAEPPEERVLVGIHDENGLRCMESDIAIKRGQLLLPQDVMTALRVEKDMQIYCTPLTKEGGQ